MFRKSLLGWLVPDLQALLHLSGPAVCLAVAFAAQTEVRLTEGAPVAISGNPVGFLGIAPGDRDQTARFTPPAGEQRYSIALISSVSELLLSRGIRSV